MESVSPHTLEKAPRGFTLVEMLVVLLIIAIITTIALIGQSTFNRTLLLTDTAYTIALSIREAQSLGLSSRRFDDIQNPGYGVRFSSATPDTFILFADTAATLGVPINCPVGDDPDLPDAKPGNCLYDTGDGVVETFTFGRGYTITSFCGEDVSGVKRCSDTGYLETLNMAFLRSDTETVINAERATGGWIELTNAELYLSEPDAEQSRSICVSKVGQVSVSQDPCPS